MPTTVKPTASDIITEGQLQDGYFPNCIDQDGDPDHSQVVTLIESRIDDVDAEVQLAAGSYYTSDDDRILKLLHKAEIYLTLSRLWQMIKNVMDHYDAESLPPEYVDPEQAAANRDYYAGEANAILQRYDGDSVTTPKAFLGSFESDGVDYTGILGTTY